MRTGGLLGRCYVCYGCGQRYRAVQGGLRVALPRLSVPPERYQVPGTAVVILVGYCSIYLVPGILQ